MNGDTLLFTGLCLLLFFEKIPETSDTDPCPPENAKGLP
jgi:hypothetical protein